MLSLMLKLWMSNLTLASAVLYVAAYLVAAITAYVIQSHQAFCPVYTVITLAALLHLYVLLYPKDDPPGPGGRSGLLLA